MWGCKSLPIMAVMFSSCLLIGYLASGITQLSFPVYLSGAAEATIADGVAVIINVNCLDDNIFIPVFSGLVMTGAAALF
jgi:dolichol kinase